MRLWMHHSADVIMMSALSAGNKLHIASVVAIDLEIKILLKINKYPNTDPRATITSRF